MKARLGLGLGLVASLLAGCDDFPSWTGPAATPPLARPAPETFTPESQELAAYYKRVEQSLRGNDLLRTDGGGPDAPFDDRRLAETFMAVAFSREFTDAGSALVRREAATRMHRWATPVRIEPMFGAGVPEMQRADDRASIRRFAERLNSVTRHPVSYVEQGGNFQVLVLTDEERRVAGPLLTRLIPGIRSREIDLIQNLDRATYCLVLASDPKDDGVIGRAVAIIRAELPPLLRLSCVHEEIAQGLGLANDSPRARPSIFNDDDEFGRLTAMDEKLLQILYDPRLSPGVDADTARPTVTQLAQALTAPAF